MENNHLYYHWKSVTAFLENLNKYPAPINDMAGAKPETDKK
jgi:hypothetical protein